MLGISPHLIYLIYKWTLGIKGAKMQHSEINCEKPEFTPNLQVDTPVSKVSRWRVHK